MIPGLWDIQTEFIIDIKLGYDVADYYRYE